MFSQESIRLTILQFVPFVMAVVFHEFAHGWAARKFGDPTAYDEGRMTLNPVPHVDLIGTIVFPLLSMLSGSRILFGWAKPVPIDPRRFRDFRKGLFWVSFAGPLMNLVLALVSALLMVVFVALVPKSFELREPLAAMAQLSVFLNIGLALFNLIPLPPLDGSKMIMSFMRTDTAARYEGITPYSFFILIGLSYVGFFQILGPPMLWLGYQMIGGMAFLIGLTGVAV